MKGDLRALMVRLAIDVDLLSSFIRDPQKVMRKASLSKVDRDIITSGDQDKIHLAFISAEPARNRNRRRAKSSSRSKVT